jgi:hypothetical protein
MWFRSLARKQASKRTLSKAATRREQRFPGFGVPVPLRPVRHTMLNDGDPGIPLSASAFQDSASVVEDAVTLEKLSLAAVFKSAGAISAVNVGTRL